jgi:hypothetical protein
MFRTIIGGLSRDRDYPERQYTIDIYNRVLEGAIYDHLQYAFHEEKGGSDEYVPLRKRRPCVKTNLCRVVVDDTVSLLFGEGRFPKVDCGDEADFEAALLKLAKDSHLNDVMLDAATRGAVGSVAVQMRILPQDDASKTFRAFFEVHSTEFLTPVYAKNAPDVLVKIRERYKVKGSDLRDHGYAIPDDALRADFWFGRDWDAKAETWYQPWPVVQDDAAQPKPETVDEARTVKHDLGFCPWVWIKNLPGRLKLVCEPGVSTATAMRYSDVDGLCTFAAAIETVMEIDYLLSQGGRGLKYSMDPILLLKEPAAQVDGAGEVVKSPSNALITSEKGDAKLLETSGAGFSTMLDFVRQLRETALEAIHGNRASPEKLSAAQSGRAMELLNQALIWLAEKMRSTYGEGALLALYRMALRANEKFPLIVGGELLGQFDPNGAMALKWAPWFPPTYSDRKDTAITVSEHRKSHTMSRETAIKTIAGMYDVEDVQAELTKITADERSEIALLATLKGAGQVRNNDV